MKKSHIILIIGVILLLTVIALVLRSAKNSDTASNTYQNSATATPEPPQKIDEHLTVYNTLRDVNFCGNTYKVKQVMIDGVDVVQRIAELATNNLIPAQTKPYAIKSSDLTKEICDNANPHNSSGIVDVTWQDTFSGQSLAFKNDPVVYPILIDGNMYFIAIPSGNIYLANGFDGSPEGPLGKLK